MKTKAAAIVTIKDAPRIGRLAIATWLEQLAKFLRQHRREIGPRFTARYLYTALVCLAAASASAQATKLVGDLGAAVPRNTRSYWVNLTNNTPQRAVPTNLMYSAAVFYGFKGASPTFAPTNNTATAYIGFAGPRLTNGLPETLYASGAVSNSASGPVNGFYSWNPVGGYYTNGGGTLILFNESARSGTTNGWTFENDNSSNYRLFGTIRSATPFDPYYAVESDYGTPPTVTPAPLFTQSLSAGSQLVHEAPTGAKYDLSAVFFLGTTGDKILVQYDQ